MNDGNRHDLTDAQRLARDAVRSLPRPEADADFRARLKQEFMSGSLASETGDTTGRGKEAGSASRGRTFGPWLAWAPVAAAAVVLLIVFGFNPLPGPVVTRVVGEGSVVVDGRAFPAADRDAYADLVGPGSHVQVTGDAQVDIQYPGSMVIRVLPGSDLDLPGRPGRWFGRHLASRLETGEISVMTWPGFQGNHLAIATPDGRAVISGTVANVYVNEDLTCICLLHGHVEVDAPDGKLGAVEAGMRWVLHRDGTAPEYLTIAPPHRDHMIALQEDAGTP